MAPMKAPKGMEFMKTNKFMTKGALIKAIAEKPRLKTKVCSGPLQSLATPGSAEVKKNGIFTSPGLRRTKTRPKPATKLESRRHSASRPSAKQSQPGPSSRPSQSLHSKHRSELSSLVSIMSSFFYSP